MTQNINLSPSDYELKDLLDLFKKQIKLEFNCHHIGTVAIFNPATQTAQVNINYTKTFLQIDSLGDTSTITASYPILVDCPVICLGGGLGAITFPILPGDECLIFFNDRDLDNWFSGSSGSAPATGRLHAFTDAIVLVGLRSMANVLTSYNSTAVEIRMAGNTITLAADKAKINLTTGVSLELDATGKFKVENLEGDLITSLVNLLTGALVNTMLGPQPLILPVPDLAVLESFQP